MHASKIAQLRRFIVSDPLPFGIFVIINDKVIENVPADVLLFFNLEQVLESRELGLFEILLLEPFHRALSESSLYRHKDEQQNV